MGSTANAAVVYQIRWTSDDTAPLQPDDTDPLQPDHSPSAFDGAVSGLQGWNTESNLDGTNESVKSNNLYPMVELSQQPVENGYAVNLCLKYTSAEPWNPLSGLRLPNSDPPPLIIYRKSWYVGSTLSSLSVYHTAISDEYHSIASCIRGRGNVINESLSGKTEYLDMLKSKGLWPVDPRIEQNWSGRGQHVEFGADELARVDQLLKVQSTLGSGYSVVVYKVKCQRISLARKTIYASKHFTTDQAIKEIAHMTRLKHSHIIRLIGSYVWTNSLSILMYPACNHDLKEFLDILNDASTDKTRLSAMASSCLGFFSCLSSTVRYIHVSLTKHMDIKPANVLVRTRWQNRGGGRSEYSSRVYIADFGIAHSYQSNDAINTDGPTSFTRRYAAPEVVQELHRDHSADIFSLGCVFLEMFAALDNVKAEQPPNLHSGKLTKTQDTSSTAESSCTLREEVQSILSSNEFRDKSYQGNLDPLQELLEKRIPQYQGVLVLSSSTLRTILKMIQFEPQQRPTANDLVQEFGEKICCKTGPDEMEAEEEDLQDNAGRDLDRMMHEEIIQQPGELELDQEHAISSPLWTGSTVPDLVENNHVSRECNGECEKDWAEDSILFSHMSGGFKQN